MTKIETGSKFSFLQMCSILVTVRFLDSISAFSVKFGFPEVFRTYEQNSIAISYFTNPTVETTVAFYCANLLIGIMLPMAPFLVAHSIHRQEWLSLKRLLLRLGLLGFLVFTIFGMYGTLTGLSVWLFPSAYPV